MKILVIPDIHGSIHWKKNYIENIDKVDKCVVLGDYVDSFNLAERGLSAKENVEDLIATTKNDGKTQLLLGNHDASYCFFAKGDPHVSGHQSSMALEYNSLFEKNKYYFKIAVEYDGWVFSHAGFSKTWYKDCENWWKQFYKDEPFPSNAIDLANEYWLRDDLRLLNYNDHDWSGYGDSISQTPLWIRPAALITDMCYPKQIVGHTEAKEPPLFIENKSKERLIVLDSREHNSFLIFDTQKEYSFTKF